MERYRRHAAGEVSLGDRLAGAVWGHLVGDAQGVPHEFDMVDPHGQPPGTWSDDGALMLALLDSLISVGFDPEDQGRRALAWADAGAYTPDGDGMFDIGGATSARPWNWHVNTTFAIHTCYLWMTR